MKFICPIDDGLALRLIEPCDAEVMFGMIERNRDHLYPWFRWAPRIATVDEVRVKILGYLNRMAEDGSVLTLIEAEGRPVGLLYICDREVTNRRMELGYWLEESEQGKGYMTRACRAMLRHGFEDLGVNRIDITADVENRRSRALAERLGFTHEATMAKWLCFPDGRCRDMANYRLLRGDWKAQINEECD